MSDQQAEDLLAQAVAAMQHASGFDQAVTLINQALGRSRLFSQAYTRAHVLQCHVALVQNYAPRRKNRSKEKALDFRNALEVLRDSLPALRRHKDY